MITFLILHQILTQIYFIVGERQEPPWCFFLFQELNNHNLSLVHPLIAPCLPLDQSLKHRTQDLPFETLHNLPNLSLNSDSSSHGLCLTTSWHFSMFLLLGNSLLPDVKYWHSIISSKCKDEVMGRISMHNLQALCYGFGTMTVFNLSIITMLVRPYLLEKRGKGGSQVKGTFSHIIAKIQHQFIPSLNSLSVMLLIWL